MSGSTQNDNTRRADDEATEWVIQLREEPDDPEIRARFEAWLAASPLNAHAWADTAYAYNRAGDARPGFGRPRRRKVNRRSLVAMVAAACLAVAAAPAVMLRLEADHLTSTAEVREISLDDGSRAHLAPGSAIAVAHAADRRRVRLVKGQAWFDVQHDASRPFQVEARGITITVLGTAFDVKLDAAGATTEVERGRVRIEYAGRRRPVAEQLAAGDRVRVAFDGGVERATMPPEEVAAWRHRQLVVHNRPVSEVVDALRPWFRGVIVVRSSRVARERVTGLYNTADPVEALRAVTQVHGGRVTKVTPWVLVLTDD